MNQLSRRAFLKGVAAGGGGLAAMGGLGALIATNIDHIKGGYDWLDRAVEWGSTNDVLDLLTNPRAMSMGGALRIARLLDEKLDKLKPFTPPLGRQEVVLKQLQYEIVPYFGYEEILQPDPSCSEGFGGAPSYCYVTMPEEIYPEILTWAKFDGRANFHVAGRAQCRNRDALAVGMNLRFANPVSAKWWADVQVIAVLIHELAHIQGVCDDSPIMESTTQLATAEVAAAMANHKFVWGLPIVLQEIKGFAEDYAMAYALSHGELHAYVEYIESVADSSFNLASFLKSMRYWGKDMHELRRILELYGKVPYILLTEALRDSNRLTRVLTSLPNMTKRIKLDDVTYVLRHVDEMVADYPSFVEENWRSPE